MAVDTSKYIHVGQRIKDLLHLRKISQAEIGRQLEKHSQVINKALMKRDIKTDLLQGIMQVSGITITEIFEVEKEVDSSILAEPNATYGQETLLENQRLKMDLALCRKDVAFYKAQAEEKERLIKLLMERKEES